MVSVAKFAEREMKKVGAEVVWADPSGKKYRVPAGLEFTCGKYTTFEHVREYVRRVGPVQGRETRLERAVVSSQVPDVTGYSFSLHARQRYELMVEQGLAFREVLAAIESPEVVRLSNKGRAIFCAGRVGVVFEFSDAPAVVTVLWTSAVLWDEFPREAA